MASDASCDFSSVLDAGRAVNLQRNAEPEKIAPPVKPTLAQITTERSKHEISSSFIASASFTERVDLAHMMKPIQCRTRGKLVSLGRVSVYLTHLGRVL